MKLRLIIFFLFLSPVLLSSLTSGFETHYTNGGGAFDLGLALDIDRTLSGNWNLLYGLELGRVSHINQIQYLGDSYYGGLRLEPRYYFLTRSNKKFFAAASLQTTLMDVPYIQSNFIDHTLHLGISYGLKIGLQYTPLRARLVKQYTGIGVTPFIRIKNTHYFDFKGYSAQAFWIDAGIHLIFNLWVKPGKNPTDSPMMTEKKAKPLIETNLIEQPLDVTNTDTRTNSIKQEE